MKTKCILALTVLRLLLSGASAQTLNYTFDPSGNPLTRGAAVLALTGHSGPAPASAHVLLERTLLGAERVWVGAGSTRHMAGLAPGELVRLARAVPRDIVADD